MVSKDGIIVGTTKIEAIRDWARSTFPYEICIFIILVSYYRWFIESFATIVALIT